MAYKMTGEGGVDSRTKKYKIHSGGTLNAYNIGSKTNPSMVYKYSKDGSTTTLESKAALNIIKEHDKRIKLGMD